MPTVNEFVNGYLLPGSNGQAGCRMVQAGGSVQEGGLPLTKSGQTNRVRVKN